MRQKLTSLCVTIVLLGAHCLAESPTDGAKVSPDKHYSLSFAGRGSFNILDSDGATILSSRDVAELNQVIEFDDSHALWSPDSQFLAVSGGGGHDYQIFVFARSRDKFLLIPMPVLTGQYDNPYVLPEKWLKDHRLVLAISGPHAGKTSAYYYKGKAIIQVSATPLGCKILSNRIVEHYGDFGVSINCVPYVCQTTRSAVYGH